MDPETVANTFNEYFTSVHKSVRTETPIRSDGNIDIGNIRRHYSQNLKDVPEFCIAEVTESFILKQLQNLQVNKATGVGEISAKFQKMPAPIICKPFNHILNLSIKSNSYPDMLKRAKVSPIFKRGSKADINNYRPISVLPIINSVFERHFSNCMIEYLETNKFLCKN